MTQFDTPATRPDGISHTVPIRVGVHEAKTRLSEFLLDTHVWLWLLTESEHVDARRRAA